MEENNFPSESLAALV